MQEKHTTAKETDITSVLVITFVILVAALIAKVAGDFTKVTTSSSTKASSNQDIWCTNNDPLNGSTGRTVDPGYDGGSDTCVGPAYNCGGDLLVTDTSHAIDETNSFLTTSKSDTNSCYRNGGTRLRVCCRKTSNLQALGDSSCRTNLSNPDAYCTISQGKADSTTRTCPTANKSTVPCAKTALSSGTSTNSLYEGVCCNPPLKTSLTDCGRKHLDCSKFNGTFKWDNDKLKNTNSRGEKVTTQCMANASLTDAFCVNENAAVDVNGSIRCDGSQFADKVYGQYGCYTTAYGSMPSVATGPKFYCMFSEVTLSTGEKCKDKIHRY